jgi:hypothetical protein
MPEHESVELRRRAQRLRHLASRIEASLVMSLERHADSNTWRGRRPLLCLNLVRHNQDQLPLASIRPLLSCRAEPIERRNRISPATRRCAELARASSHR